MPCPRGISLESRINHENAFLWLLKGYAAGFLNRSFHKDFGISHSKFETPHAVIYRFLARPSKDGQEVDIDLPLRNFKQTENALTHSASDNGRVIPRPAAPLKHSILRDGSELAYLVQQVAITDATVLLLGESGVGKSLIAREIQCRSLRAQHPWVEINCAAIPEQLIESELFGVERGAFSGATVSRKGKFEHAHGGTVFLDEVGLLSPNAQSKLLRVLQSGEMERLGSNSTVHCDIRVIAATNENLEALVKAGKFREDLYFRLNVFPIHIPALRERKHEMPSLMSAIIRRFCDRYRKNIYRCTHQARELLLAYDWPGNIRELENVLERAVILCPDEAEIHTTHLGELVRRCNAMSLNASDSSHLSASSASVTAASIDDWADQLIESGQGSLNTIKDSLLKAAMRRSQGNLSLAAAVLGMTRGQLNYQLKKLDEVV
ncbi:Anaerobic nitric oxide reductase transcription regulator NorR [bioreactor metagenome]|uniref:Anaerobic nitric oxide reductase transcription regulator NorR n=1 Tax=bioreactor metagenome TaxID=1076179 RepID=A0A645A2I2_9ZZZZ